MVVAGLSTFAEDHRDRSLEVLWVIPFPYTCVEELTNELLDLLEVDDLVP